MHSHSQFMTQNSHPISVEILSISWIPTQMNTQWYTLWSISFLFLMYLPGEHSTAYRATSKYVSIQFQEVEKVEKLYPFLVRFCPYMYAMGVLLSFYHYTEVTNLKSKSLHNFQDKAFYFPSEFTLPTSSNPFRWLIQLSSSSGLFPISTIFTPNLKALQLGYCSTDCYNLLPSPLICYLLPGVTLRNESS
jgi:hypothetical protein